MEKRKLFSPVFQGPYQAICRKKGGRGGEDETPADIC